MSELYVGVVDNNGLKKYGLYDNRKKMPELYSEDWKPVIFETEDEAKSKLEALEKERLRENEAVPFSPEEARLYAESHYWKIASTYAKTAPHEYLMKKWLVEEDKLLYERFVATIKKDSIVAYFYEHENNYLILGDHYYWFMPLPENLAVDLINRTTIDYLEYRDGAYHYKEKHFDS